MKPDKRRPWGGVCVVCGEVVRLGWGGYIDQHGSKAQQGVCRGSGYAPRAVQDA